MSKLYFCVVEDYRGELSVSSFGGRNKTEERRFALSVCKKVHMITTRMGEALARLRSLRANAPGSLPQGVPAGSGSLS